MDNPANRPVLHTLVGWYEEPWGLIGDGQLLDLETACDFKQFGAWILVDPQDEEDLTRWEQQQR